MHYHTTMSFYFFIIFFVEKNWIVPVQLRHNLLCIEKKDLDWKRENMMDCILLDTSLTRLKTGTRRLSVKWMKSSDSTHVIFSHQTLFIYLLFIIYYYHYFYYNVYSIFLNIYILMNEQSFLSRPWNIFIHWNKKNYLKNKNYGLPTLLRKCKSKQFNLFFRLSFD